MKKLFVSIVALATVLVVTSCGKEDNTKPEITLPTDALVIDLGDEVAALVGVEAKDDKDGDVTSKVKVTGGFDFVGNSTLTYTVTDEATNTATETRPVTVKSNKLFGNYSAREVCDDNGGIDNYLVKFDESSDPTKLVMSNFFNEAGWYVVFSGDGKSMDLTMEEKTFNQGAIVVTGKATYRKVSNYDMYDFKFKVDDGTSAENYSVTFTRQ